jgi:hypothetical protein
LLWTPPYSLCAVFDCHLSDLCSSQMSLEA